MTRHMLGLFHGAEFSSRYDRMRAKEGNASGREAVGQFPDQPTLEEMTQAAISVLSKNSNGFFLMVEGGSVDRELHRMDPNRAIDEVLELDKRAGKDLTQRRHHLVHQCQVSFAAEARCRD